ncbi:MAG: DUF2442 domain-containing protein [Pseudomonadota bacterium]
MIKLIAISVLGDARLALTFSDGSSGVWSAADIIARDTELTRALSDASYFARVFIEGGALAWPNGLELSGHSLHQKLDAAGQLHRQAA